MKRMIVITLSILGLLIGSGMISANPKAIMNFDDTGKDIIKLDQSTDQSRPIFVNITNGNSQLIRERNETLGLGAIVKSDLNNNVTITYKMVNGLNTTNMLLFADLPGNYSLTNSTETLKFTYQSTIYENITIPYSGVFQVNVSISFYTVEINVTNTIIPFFASADTTFLEDQDNSPRNLLTTQTYWSLIEEDDFFIQNENVTISVIGNDTGGTDVFGLRYSQDFGSPVFLNFTTTPDGNNETGTLDLGTFEPPSTLEITSIAYIDDGNQTRMIERLEYIVIEIGDGSPEIEIDIFNVEGENRLVNTTYYTQNATVSFNFSAMVPKGNITEFILVTNVFANITIQASTNASLLGENMNETITFNQDKTNLTIYARTNKGLEANITFLIVFDETKATGSLSLEGGSNDITSTSGRVVFNFEYQDDNSGIRQVILDLGNGIFVEVTGEDSYTYNYVGFIGTVTFEASLNIVDNANNVERLPIVISITYDPGINDTEPGYGLLTLLFVVILLLIILFPRIKDYIEKLRA